MQEAEAGPAEKPTSPKLAIALDKSRTTIRRRIVDPPWLDPLGDDLYQFVHNEIDRQGGVTAGGPEDKELDVRIAVIGTGNVGGALGRGWSTAGHEVIWGTRRPDGPHDVTPVAALREAAATADVVVLAVPFDALGETVATIGDLTGRVVVDATNTLDKSLPEGASSGAEYLASLAKGASVVKAFNTMGWEIMADPVIDGRRAVCFICAENLRAREVVAGLAGDLGFEAIDAGGLENARHLESLAALWVHLAFRAGLGRQFAFSLLHRSKE